MRETIGKVLGGIGVLLSLLAIPLPAIWFQSTALYKDGMLSLLKLDGGALAAGVALLAIASIAAIVLRKVTILGATGAGAIILSIVIFVRIGAFFDRIHVSMGQAGGFGISPILVLASGVALIVGYAIAKPKPAPKTSALSSPAS